MPFNWNGNLQKLLFDAAVLVNLLAFVADVVELPVGSLPLSASVLVSVPFSVVMSVPVLSVTLAIVTGADVMVSFAVVVLSSCDSSVMVHLRKEFS